MNTKQIVGLTLVIVGVILFVVGLNASESMSDQVNKFFTGRFTDTTVWYMIGGVAAMVFGSLMLAFGGRRHTK